MSTLFLYTCPVSLITETPREQPHPRFIFTIRGGHYGDGVALAEPLESHTEGKCKDIKWRLAPDRDYK